MKGQHELPINGFKSFAREHGARKKAMKVNWITYIQNLNKKKM